MTDFSLLSAVKSHLQSNIKDLNFHLSRPTEEKTPFCVVELDDALATGGKHLSYSTPYPSKLKFRTVCFHDELGVKNSLDQSQLINHFLDGSVVKLKGGCTAVIKLIGSRVDISKCGEKKTVSNFYDSLIR